MPDFFTPFETLVEHFENNKIHCHVDTENKFIGFSMWGHSTNYKCGFRIDRNEDVLRIELELPVRGHDVKIRPLVLETIARANNGLAIGNFNIDMRDGEVTYHIGQAIRDTGLDDETIGCLFATAMDTVERYFPAIMRVMYGGHTPEDAIYLAELPVHSARLAARESAASGKAVEKSALPPPRPSAKKPVRRPRKKNAEPQSGDQPGLFDPSKGEGTDRPPKENRG
jgi:hypothetical protein